MLGVGLINIGAGIYVWADSGNFSWFSGGFVVVGLILVLIFGFTGKTRRSFGHITFYLLVLAICFLVEIGFTMGILFYSDFEDKISKENANLIRYIFLGMCAALLLSFLLGYCYRRSLMAAEFRRDYDLEGRLNKGHSRKTTRKDSRKPRVSLM